MKDIIQRLYEEFDKVPIIDTHSHLAMKEGLYDKNQDFLQNLMEQYILDDLICAGMTPEEAARAADREKPLGERFQIFEHYWKRTSNTGYARLLRETLRAHYGVDRLTADNVGEIAAKYRAQMSTPGFYQRILREKCHIIRAVSDLSYRGDVGIGMLHDPELFLPVYRMDYVIQPRDTADLARIEMECGFPVNSFDDMMNAVQALLERALKNGAVGPKSGLAYERSLYYAFPDYQDARKGFECIRRSRVSLYEKIQVPFVTSKDYQDFMMHEVLRWANKRGLVYQFHTGYQVGQGNHQEQVNPLLLNNLFLEYRNVKFDIFHAGYPHFYQLGTLAKQFPNVYANLCWTHVVSPLDARTAFRSWLSTVPMCKILGFGDDVHGIEAVAGHLAVARENICTALASEIREGIRSFEECIEILWHILYINPAELFGIQEPIKF